MRRLFLRQMKHITVKVLTIEIGATRRAMAVGAAGRCRRQPRVESMAGGTEDGTNHCRHPRRSRGVRRREEVEVGGNAIERYDGEAVGKTCALMGLRVTRYLKGKHREIHLKEENSRIEALMVITQVPTSNTLLHKDQNRGSYFDYSNNYSVAVNIPWLGVGVGACLRNDTDASVDVDFGG